MENKPHSQLIALPTELIIRTFELLPSLSDALTLRAACRRLQQIWTLNRATITKEIIIRDIECPSLALQLLADQRSGPRLELEELPNRDLMRLVRNKDAIDIAIKKIEEFAIPRLDFNEILQSRRAAICRENETHPPALTRTERHRIIKALYQIWSLTERNPDITRIGLRAMRLRELFCLTEMAKYAPVLDFPKSDAWEQFLVVRRISAALDSVYWKAHRSSPPNTASIRQGPKPALCVVWDFWQNNLKSVVCGRTLSDLRRDAQSKSMEHLWDYESGDELFIEDD